MPMIEVDDTELKGLRKSSALYDALLTRIPTLEAAAARVPTLEAEVTTFKAERAESTWTNAGIIDPKVRRIFQMEHEEQAAVAGGEADLGKWLGNVAADPTKAPAHLAPFIKAQPAAGAGTGTGGAPNAPRLPDTNAGARSPTGTAPAVTPEQIAQMDGAQFAAALPGLQAANPALAAFPTLPGAPATNPSK